MGDCDLLWRSIRFEGAVNNGSSNFRTLKQAHGLQDDEIDRIINCNDWWRFLVASVLVLEAVSGLRAYGAKGRCFLSAEAALPVETTTRRSFGKSRQEEPWTGRGRIVTVLPPPPLRK